MRNYFAEGDLVCAEVQQLFSDGAASLQTRSTRYGKLRNGQLVIVPPVLVRRCKTHFTTLPCGVDVVLGLNGYIWVSKSVPQLDVTTVETMSLYANENGVRVSLVRKWVSD